MQSKLKAYTRHTWVLRTGARPSRPMAALSLLAIGIAMTRRDALPWDANDALQKRKTQVRRAFILGLSLFLPAGAALAGAAEEVQTLDPYVRAMPPGQSVSAAFLGLSNTGKEHHALVAVETPAAMMAEMHEHTMADGMMQMREVEKIDLPAGATVELKPGGLHIMLMGLKSQLKPGDGVEITLIYGDGSKTTVKAPVRKIGAMMR
jgi:copper(I)-binding protein